MKDLFIGFLKENDLTDSYDKSFVIRKNKHKDYSFLSDFLDETDPSDYISALCLWDETEKGASFWSDVEDNWLNTLDENKNETKN
ncbi:MAG: hypothetical protein ACYC5G_04705 [Candidatus Doudnabacteria bacterium]